MNNTPNSTPEPEALREGRKSGQAIAEVSFSSSQRAVYFNPLIPLDELMSLKPGTKLYAANDEMWRLQAIALKVIADLDEGDGNAPGHAHSIAGVWDSDNGLRAGKKCEWCALWAEFKLAARSQAGGSQ